MTYHTNPLRLTMLLVRQRRLLFVGACLLWFVIHILPVITGLLMKGVFDALAGSEAAGYGPWTYLALALALDVGRIFLFIGAIRAWVSYWAEVTLHLRSNILRHLFTAAGSRRLPDSPGEAVTRFRDDVNDIGEYVEMWVDSWGFVGYAVVALVIMAFIDPVMTLLACIPLSLTVVLTNLLRPRIRSARRLSREATSRVTGFLGETFGSVLAVKASGREKSVMRRFVGFNDARRERALKDTVLTELFRTVTDNMVNIAMGVILLVGAAGLRDGSFSVGDFALFVTYLPRLTFVMTFLGLMVVQHKRTGVAYERLGRLMVDAPAAALVTPREYDLEHSQRPFAASVGELEPLRELKVEGLSYHHSGTTEGIADVSFTINRGEFVVVTGRVGSGKTTLVRVLLGLLPKSAGSIYWNGAAVADPATYFVPPRTAYTGQVPRLFSDSLRENIMLGGRLSGGEIDRAIDLAVLGEDVASLHHGLDTEVGTRGVRLSGGQVQRAAAARMFLRDAELLVFDDLSSALDVETERRLWDGLFASRDATYLVVSHRRAALERADRVIVMEAGRVQAQGSLEDVTRVAPSLRLLLSGDGLAGGLAGAPDGAPDGAGGDEQDGLSERLPARVPA
ncbi:MAG TPA: ABC transporter ATP-binding protein [Trueperaceae bacterium]|nr:ABC transporter ATP-binding protein [Trueperaceae bacterium]